MVLMLKVYCLVTLVYVTRNWILVRISSLTRCLYFCFRCSAGPRICSRNCQQYGLLIWWYWINWKFSSPWRY